jgi:type I site-specific restriction endonuclease
MLRTLETPPPVQYSAASRELSKALFCQLAKVKYAGWRHRVEFKRGRKHSISEIFQDLVAYYLRCALDKQHFEVLLEQSRPGVGENKRTQADILILKDAKPVFIIEAKTTIGWARPDENTPEPYASLEQRLKMVSENFGVEPDNVIYVFEEPTNVSDVFTQNFWDNSKTPGISVKRPATGPLSKIYPLFYGTDPLHWGWEELAKETPREKRRSPTSWYPKKITEERFLREAETRIVTPLEHVIRLIRAAKPA